MQLLKHIPQLIAKLLSFMIMGLRPLLGPATCRFPISCGEFAVQVLQKKPLYKAAWAIIQRLLVCISVRKS